MALVVKNLPANEGDMRDRSSIPESGRSSGGGHGNPLQYSCLENPMDRGAWRATVHAVAKTMYATEHAHIHISYIAEILVAYILEFIFSGGEIVTDCTFLVNFKV